MLLLRENPRHYSSQIIAAEDPQPICAPRYVHWPSICDTTRTNWLNPSAEPQPPDPLPEAETIRVYAGSNVEPNGSLTSTSPPLHLSDSPPLVVSDAATPDQQAALKRYSFSHIAAPIPTSPDLFASMIGAPGVPLPPLPQPEQNKPPAKKAKKKRGRPLLFGPVKRAEFLGMIKSGCTVRYAARRIGVDPATIRNACRKDPLFANSLDRAQQERDVLAIRRIQNAGEKSWRAAAWLLERNEPKEFALKHKAGDPWSVRGQRRLKKLITEVVDNRLASRPETAKQHAMINRAVQLIDDRLAEIDSQAPPYHPSNGHDDPLDSEAHSDPIEYDVLGDDEFSEEPDEEYVENDGYPSEDAAVEAYRQALRKLHEPQSTIESDTERYRQQLRIWNAYLHVQRRPR